MASPFAALESRLIAVALAKLANATATIAAQAVDGIFEADTLESLHTQTTRPTFVASATSLASVANGAALTVTCTPLGMTAVAFTVAEKSAEQGLTRLWLRKAS